MKYKTVNYILLSLLIVTFFFQTIPIPTESQRGVCQPVNIYVEEDEFCSPNDWLYGGMRFISLNDEIQYKNYPFVFSFLSLFVVGFGVNKLWYRK